MSAANLDALGIDRATTRWRAVRAYLQGLRGEAEANIDRVVIGLIVAGKAGQNAKRAGRARWVSASDYADAVEWMSDRLAR